MIDHLLFDQHYGFWRSDFWCSDCYSRFYLKSKIFCITSHWSHLSENILHKIWNSYWIWKEIHCNFDLFLILSSFCSIRTLNNIQINIYGERLFQIIIKNFQKISILNFNVRLISQYSIMNFTLIKNAFDWNSWN